MAEPVAQADVVGLRIDQLPEALEVLLEDLLVMQQNGVAKKLSGAVLVAQLAAALDGHGGIQSIAKTDSKGLVDTFTVTLADGTTATFTVTNGRSVADIQYAGTVENVTTVQISYNDGTRQNLTMALPRKYGETPFDVIELPQNQKLPRYAKNADGTLANIGTLSTFSTIRPCPRYLGFRLGEGAEVYLYICDYVNGEYVPDSNYEFSAFTNTSGQVLFNYMTKPGQSRIVEVEEGKFFYYTIRKAGDGVTIIGSDAWPKSMSENIAIVPDSTAKSSDTHAKNGANYAVVLPEDCDYAVMVADPALNQDGTPAYQRDNFNVACVAKGPDDETPHIITRIESGVSFGHIPAGAGAALLTIPGGCPVKNVTIYTSKPVEVSSVGGRRKKAEALANKLIRDFGFISQKSILWNDSSLPLTTGKRYYGVPYSSRWVNSHYVGFEVSVETALNALNDPYSVAYDGGKQEIRDALGGGKEAVWFDPVSGSSEIPRNDDKPTEYGGPGYGLVCSAFTSLIFGNPYPQSNRGITFDGNFAIAPMTALVSGTVVTNKTMTHCVMVDELYREGYSILEAADPCVAKTVHTSTRTADGALNSKTRIGFLDDYFYTITNLDDSGYDSPLLKFPTTMPNGVVRPWRGHKSVYGPWDRLENGGSGIGVTIHPTEEQLADPLTPIPVNVTYTPMGSTEPVLVHRVDVAVTTKYLSIADAVTAPGTYTVFSDTGNAEQFRYYDHEPVTLTIEEDGRAVYSHDDVLYAYVRVTGYGGTWGRQLGNDSGPMVIAAGKYYPDLVDMGRIEAVRAAIVADPATDCWGKYSCLCSKGGTA
jgi:hypothetical protein